MSKDLKKTKELYVELITDKQYKKFSLEIKNKVRSSRLQAALAVNTEVIRLYWYIGKSIIEKQTETKWGDKLITSLSNDLQHTFPETHGFSIPSLKRMRMFAQYYPELSIGSQPVTQLPAITQLPWGHIQLLLFKTN